VTVYVDNFRMPAVVGNVRGRWSHLTADTEAELHTFAERLGLQRAWYQAKCKHAPCNPCPHWHYDVVDSKRLKAIHMGAKAIDIRELGALIRAR
jgi:hypothetical protein